MYRDFFANGTTSKMRLRIFPAERFMCACVVGMLLTCPKSSLSVKNIGNEKSDIIGNFQIDLLQMTK